MRTALSLLALLLVACSEAPTAPPTDGPRPQNAPNVNSGNTGNYWQELDGVTTWPTYCIPEVVAVSGWFHTLAHRTQLPDGTFRDRYTFNLREGVGIGQTTGEVYRVQNTYPLSFDYDYPNNGGGPIRHATYTFQIHSPQGGDLSVHYNFLITINANGDVTTEKEFVDYSCDP